MTIIELLNKIANGEELPKYIKYYDKLHQKKDIMMCCYNNIIYKLDNNIIDLTDVVEILEEENKEFLANNLEFHVDDSKTDLVITLNENDLGIDKLHFDNCYFLKIMMVSGM